MHELALATAVIDTALRHAGGRRVAAVSVRIGALRQAVPDSLQFHFEIAARGTDCEEADLDQQRVAAVLRCEGCGAEWDPAPPPATEFEALIPRFHCPACGSTRSDVLRGDELEVASIDVFDDDVPAPERGGWRAMHRTRVRVAEDLLDANATIARANRDDFDRNGVSVVNLMSAPGAGKTSLLEAALTDLSQVSVGVLEGDVQGSIDTDRIAGLHVPVTQINTDPGFGGECHLDANMVRSAIPELPLGEIDLLVVENVGNLVCPAEFRIGEDARVMVAATTEGEDKPLKYPLMYRTCELVLINKIDLIPHLDFDLDRFLDNLDSVNPGVERILVSATTGDGIAGWRDWLMAVPDRSA